MLKIYADRPNALLFQLTAAAAAAAFLHPAQQQSPAQNPHRIPGSWPCSICGQAYSTKSHLKRHMNTHAGKYPYTCTACGKGSTNPTRMKEHMTVHTGINYFHCETCGESFRFKLALQKHQALTAGQCVGRKNSRQNNDGSMRLSENEASNMTNSTGSPLI